MVVMEPKDVLYRSSQAMPDANLLAVMNPATGELVRHYDAHQPDQVSQWIEEAHMAQRRWQRTSFQHRAERIQRAGEILRARVDAYAELMAVEMGKPIRQGRSELEKCAWVCDYYAHQAESFLADRVIESDAKRSYVTCRPLGVVLAVMPWNFPFWQVFRFAAPALMAGNAAVLKHASNVPGCALAIEQVLHDAGIPQPLFRTLLIGSAHVKAVIEHRRIAAATLTGSTPAGQAIASLAGQNLKKTVLELGGSDPYIILADADLEHAASVSATSRLINSGQSCIAAKRFIVEAPVYDRFIALLSAKMAEQTLGDPLDESTDIGPQARIDLRDELHQQVQASINHGARCILGGEVPKRPGAFYPATVLVDVTSGCPAYDEELFGPVAAVIRAENEADAIRIANDTPFGLGAAVFTRDEARGQRIASEELDAGCCFVNALVKSDPRLPFGGIKGSGYGRELSDLGIREFVNQKTVYVAND